MKTTVPRNSPDHRCGIGLEVVEPNPDQAVRALIAFGLHRKKEETRALILEENVRKDLAKPWISNRQIHVGSGTVLTRDDPDEVGLPGSGTWEVGMFEVVPNRRTNFRPN